MKLHRLGAIALRMYYLYSGSPTRIMPLFGWVAIDIVVWGFITRYLNSVSGSGFNFVPVMLGAVLMWDFFSRVMQGVTMAFFEDVWSRNFLNVFATPLRVSEYLCGLVLASMATSSVGLVAMLVLAVMVFGLTYLSVGWLLALFLSILLLFGIALGIMATAMVLRLGPAAEWLVWPIPAMISPFVGVFYPLSTLPPVMRIFSRILPPSYVFEGLRALVLGKPFEMWTLYLGALLAVGYVGLAGWFFQATYRQAVRTGLIARYSAESLS
ncbi:MAG: ABC transporter permease [Bryobacteraceae bacterium]